MTIKRLLLSPDDLTPSSAEMEVVGVFNPGAALLCGEVVLLLRVAERPRERRDGLIGLPRWTPAGSLVMDWVREEDVEWIDPRVVKFKTSGLVRLTFTSHLRVARCEAGRAVREISGPVFLPDGDCEEYGVEDPRVTPWGDRFYITYVAVSRHGPATSLASTKDFRTFERHGVIFCPENKDVILFPEQIGSEFTALHRPVCATPFTRPEMWIASSPDLLHWGRHRQVAVPGGDWQSGRVGGGAPPLRVRAGWLVMYHGNRLPTRQGDVGAYCGGALLLDPDDPSRVIRHLTAPCLTPERDFEVHGFVPNVVFPTGIVRDGPALLVYYGAADESTAVAEFSEQDLLDSMTDLDELTAESPLPAATRRI